MVKKREKNTRNRRHWDGKNNFQLFSDVGNIEKDNELEKNNHLPFPVVNK